MDYVEFYRVRRALTLFTIVIGVATIIAVVGLHATLAGHAIVIDDSGASRPIDAHNALAKARIPLGTILGCAGYVSVVMATVFAWSLNKENDGAHFVFVKPISRERLALQYFAIDAIGILSAFAIGCVAGFAALASFGLLGHVTSDGRSVWIGLLGLAIAFMWYGIMQAISAGYPGKGGSLVGWSWAVFGLLVGLQSATFLGPAVVGLARVLNIFNPIAYFSGLVSSNGGATVSSLIALPLESRVFVTFGFGIVGCAIAVRQWKRVEV